MVEFNLSEARIESEDLTIGFRKRSPRRIKVDPSQGEDQLEEVAAVEPVAPAAPPAPKGIPVSSPMNGIYYASPSPSSPPFVKVGESVTAGQVVGLIEAMKVFNEITSTISGVVLSTEVESGEIVQPGDALLYIG